MTYTDHPLLPLSPPTLTISVSQLGLVLGPLIGGALTEYTTWRWCKSAVSFVVCTISCLLSYLPYLISLALTTILLGFYINLPVGGMVAILLVFTHVPDQTIKPKGRSVLRTIQENLDLTGFVLFAPAAIQFLLALQYGGNQYAWNSVTVIGLFCGAGGTFIVFLAWEYHKGDAAMIPFSMVGKRAVWSSCLVMLFLMSMMFCASYYLPIYFQAVKGVSPMTSGVYLLPSILSQLLMAVVSGALGKDSSTPPR
jgi:MFS family permease